MKGNVAKPDFGREREEEKRAKLDEGERMAEGKDSKNVITEKRRQEEDVMNEGRKGERKSQ